MILRDKDGWPVELIEGHPIKNFFRLLIHGNFRQTWHFQKGGTSGIQVDNAVSLQTFTCCKPDPDPQAGGGGRAE